MNNNHLPIKNLYTQQKYNTIPRHHAQKERSSLANYPFFGSSESISIQSPSGEKRTIGQENESNKKRIISSSKNEKLESISHNNKVPQEKSKSIQIRRVQSYEKEPSGEGLKLFNSFNGLPFPEVLGESPNITSPGIFLAQEKKVIVEKKYNLPDFLKNATLDELNAIKEAMQRMQVDVEELKQSCSLQSAQPTLIIKEKTTAEVFAHNFVLGLKNNNKAEAVTDSLINHLVQEPFLSSYINVQSQKEDSVKYKLKKGIIDVFNKEMISSGKKYPQGGYDLYLKVVDIYEFVLKNHNELISSKK